MHANVSMFNVQYTLSNVPMSMEMVNFSSIKVPRSGRVSLDARLPKDFAPRRCAMQLKSANMDNLYERSWLCTTSYLSKVVE